MLRATSFGVLCRSAPSSNAFDYVAVAGDDLPSFDPDDVTLAEQRGGYRLQSDTALPLRQRFAAHRAERVRLRFAPPFSHRLREVSEEDCEPEPGSNCAGEPLFGAGTDERVDEQDCRDQSANLDDEHHGITEEMQGVELRQCVDRGAPDDVTSEDRDARLAFARNG
jgi:hypothetical protein